MNEQEILLEIVQIVRVKIDSTEMNNFWRFYNKSVSEIEILTSSIRMLKKQ